MQIASDGQISSEILTVRRGLVRMKQSDPARAEALIQNLNELELMRDSEQIKAKAKEIADKLQSL